MFRYMHRAQKTQNRFSYEIKDLHSRKLEVISKTCLKSVNLESISYISIKEYVKMFKN